MCGIAGIWQWGRPHARPDGLDVFTQALAHRGPDGDGFFYDAASGLGLGHRRLAILDLSETGRQPLSYGDGRYALVFNGEIYNFVELRRELEAEGFAFRTQTDAEVIPAAFARWGAQCQLRFNGMWAFALWDARERKLLLSRDRFGIKPLYYLHENGRFCFASELKAFLRLAGFAAREDVRVLRRALSNPFSVESTAECLLEKVRRLPAGHCLEVASGRLELRRWWNTLDHLVSPPATLDEQAEQFRELFLDSCRLRLRSDVPVGTCLSGGLDSSAVLCGLAAVNARRPAAQERLAADWQQAFVAAFPGTPLDERPFAEAAIGFSGAQPRFLTLDPTDLAQDLERLICDFEDITYTLPWPMWALYRELRRNGVVVSLDGHGGDELLGGYPHYVTSALQDTAGLLFAPRRCRELSGMTNGLLPADSPEPRPGLSRRLARQLGLVLPPCLIRPSWRLRARQLAKRCLARRLFPWLREPRVEEPRPDKHDLARLDGLGMLNAQLYIDFHHTILPTILRNFDRCSMAHGVEVRMPFLDWRLVCFAFSLPAESKLGGGYTKRILRQAMRGLMPEEIRTRKTKIGFNSPLPQWFAGPLKEWLRERTNERSFVQSELWDGPAVREFVERRSRAGNWRWTEAESVWLLVHACLWRSAFARPTGGT